MKFKNRILLLIDVLKASFISLVPFYILHSFVLLLIELSKNLFLDFPLSIENLNNLSTLLNSIFPILINISISYHLASLYYISVNRLLIIVLSLLVYLSVDVLKDANSLDMHFIPDSIFLAILIPLFTCFFISRLILNVKSKNKIEEHLSNNIATAVIYIIPFTFTFLISTTFFYSIYLIFNIDSKIVLFHEGSEAILVFFRTTVSNLLWGIGIHGPNFFDSFINIKILEQFFKDSLNYHDFINYFMVIGGGGCGLSLLFAIFLASKDKHITFIGKLAFPFVIFNINEILIFGIPIFMNFSLLVPFILVPLVNFLITYPLIMYTDLIVFHNSGIAWITPPLLNIYIATNGSLLALLIQIILIALGTLIYIPFIKKYSMIQSSTLSFEKIANKLEVTKHLDSKADIKFQEAQSFLVKSHFKVNRVIEMINQNNLVLFYQPKIDLLNNTCKNFEALLRIENKNGIIEGPDFILDIENSGLAPVLDIWVCREVKKDIEKWKMEDFNPEISINIFPHTLEDRKSIMELSNILQDCNVCFEILERRALLNRKIIDNLLYLKEKGFKISLDDLGVGYTNFLVLYELPLDIVKLDREIIKLTNTKKGLLLYNNICKICNDLGFKIILEGIETKEELQRLVNDKIHFIQGWHYSKAIPFEKVHAFSKEFKV